MNPENPNKLTLIADVVDLSSAASTRADTGRTVHQVVDTVNVLDTVLAETR